MMSSARPRFRSLLVERCSTVIAETPIEKNDNVKNRSPTMKTTSASDSILLASGCGCPTTSTVSAAAANSIVTVVSRPKSRGIVHSITESGKARLVFEDNFTRMKGVLLNEYEESFSITGTSAVDHSTLEDSFMALQASLPSLADIDESARPIVHRTMTITVVDSEVGQTFRVENVELEITVRPASPPATAAAAMPSANVHPLAVSLPPSSGWGMPQLNVTVRHPAISFRTDEVFIGNKAEIEMRKYLGMDASRLARINSRSAPHSHNHHSSGQLPMTPSATPSRYGGCGGAPPPPALYIGVMTLNIVSMERTAPSMRRVSTCDSCATNIIEQANDFLV